MAYRITDISEKPIYRLFCKYRISVSVEISDIGKSKIGYRISIKIISVKISDIRCRQKQNIGYRLQTTDMPSLLLSYSSRKSIRSYVCTLLNGKILSDCNLFFAAFKALCMINANVASNAFTGTVGQDFWINFILVSGQVPNTTKPSRKTGVKLVQDQYWSTSYHIMCTVGPFIIYMKIAGAP